jgi:polyketide synthase 12
MGDVSGAGLGVADHPLLGAAVQVAGGEGWLFTGRLSLDTHPWLADHAVLDTVLLPGTGFLELVLAAGRQAGCGGVEELTLEAPLVFAPGGAVQLQIALGEPDAEGRREVSVYSRAQSRADAARAEAADEVGDAGGWTRHASGTLTDTDVASEGQDADGAEALGSQWPPAGAQELDVESLYDRLAEAGFNYGPVFQGVQTAWRADEAIYAEIALEEGAAEEASRFGVHPALLDAGLHCLFLLDGMDALDGGGVVLPFSLGEVSLQAEGVSSLRVRLARGEGSEVKVAAFDEVGDLVLSIGSLALRPLEVGQLGGAPDTGGSLLESVWVELPMPGLTVARPSLATLGDCEVPLGAGDRGESYTDLAELVGVVAGGAPAPDAVFVSIAGGDSAGGLAEATRAGVKETLELLQAWLAQPVLADSRLVLFTSGAAAVEEGEVPDLLAASVWGLLRSAQSEHPDRFVIVDGEPAGARSGDSGETGRDDGGEASGGVESSGAGGAPGWAELLAVGEPQLAIRGGRAFAPRLRRIEGAPGGVPALDPEGTVLITGGTGTLGALVARHLASEHEVRHLLLASRQGMRAEGAGDLLEDLAELGCEARIVACDVCERDQVRELVASVPREHPLRAVIHTAGALRDATIESLTAEQVDEAMRPKVDAALHLHQLTADLGLAEFVLFSSAAGVLGGAGQGNYAAGNAFLDALALARRAQGDAGVSLAWGLWEKASGLTGGLGGAGRARFARQGIAPLSSEQALGLFDRGRAADEGLLVAVGLDRAGLRAQARVGVLPPLLSGLVRMPARREGGGSLARRLAGVPSSEWDAMILEVVRGQAAAVLGHDSPAAVDPERAFKDLGFDSLGAVELRGRLAQVTGVRLPATLVFDHPSCAAVARLLRSRVEGLEHGAGLVSRRRADAGEPVAIVGMSARYPGGVATPQELWELVAEGRDAISGFPADRGWDLERLYDPDPDHLGTSYARDGGFLYDAGDFDAGFFKIGPREARAMDPQQRLLLEATWEALEDAGIDPVSLRGTQTGVFAGVMYGDYGAGGAGAGGDESEGYLFGSTGSVVSGRVAYSFGFEGPAVSVDTACSSSLVALHLACQAVRSGECELALAGGVTVMSNPRLYVGFSRQRGLSRDGRCRSFAAGADGTGFSEGAGLLVLERLSDARRLGHRVLGVVRGSAVNQDGASNGLSAPNGPSQERVIRGALAEAGLSPADVDAVEAHGTGTTLGDPIEAQALLATYGRGREAGPLWLGSIKSNIGHSQAAAGVAGVIKMVKAFEHGLLPRTLHVDEPSSEVDWSAGEVRLLTEPQQWRAGERPRRAGVSSFGASGTNAHVVIEEPPPVAEDTRSGETPIPVVAWEGVVPLVVSGRGEAGLCGQAGRLREFLAGYAETGSPGTVDGVDAAEARDVGLLDVAFSLVEGRAVLEDRAVVLGGDRGGLVERLGVLAGGGVGEGVVRGVAGGGRPVFVFPGQGAQWEGMAVELLDSSSVFADALRACGGALEELVDWRVEDVLRGVEGAPGLERVDVVQPVSFAVMVALAGLWRSFGVEPGVVVGHSQGEIAAACVAGGLSLRDAARVVVLRSRLLGEVLAGRGGMVSVALGLGRVEELLEGWGGRVGVAAVNGPSSVVVSGEAQALDEFLAGCEGDGVWARRVAVDYASHSAAVEELREELLVALDGIEPVSCGVPFFSTATGGLLDTAELDGGYWYRSLRERVRFEEAVRALAGEACAFVEVSSHPVLTVAVGETLEDLGVEERVGVVGSLRRGEGGPERFVESLAQAWVCGVPVDWRVLFAGSGAQRVELPKYAFQRERYWLVSKAGMGDVSGAGLGVADHPLLGAAVQVAGGEAWLFTGRLSLDTHPWLADHAVLDTVLLPGTGFLELVLAAGRQAGCEGVEELTLEAPLVFAPGGAVQLQIAVGEPDAEGRREVSVYSQPQSRAEATGDNGEAIVEDGEAGGWTRHASGTLKDTDAASEGQGADGAELLGSQWPPAGAEDLDVEFLYDRLSEAGFGYGPVFQGVRAAWRADNEIYAEIALEEGAAEQAPRFGIHPALLDAALHTGLLEWAAELSPDGQALPFSLGGVRLWRDGLSALRVRLTRGENNTLSLAAFDEVGELALSVGSIAVRPIEAGLFAPAHRRGHDSLHRLEWVEAPISPAAGEPRRVALLGELELAGVDGERHANLEALVEAIEAGGPAPEVVLLAAPATDAGQPLALAARAVVQQTLALLQAWLARPELADSQLVLLTRGAVAIDEAQAPELATAPLWGLLRTAQSEHPGRFLIVDCDPTSDAAACGEVAWQALLAAGEPQLALRGERAYAPRLVALEGGRTVSRALLPPAGEDRWHLAAARRGTLDDLALLASPRAHEPLAPGEVRIAVHAGGLNFRDVLIALGLYPGAAAIGSEGAGVVLEVGEGVEDLAPGERVMGLMPDAFGPVAVTERELVVAVPPDWSFVQAAAVPTVFLTAYYALVDLAGLERGESLLIHAATGGVGMAALQLARHLGAEVFATASPAKLAVLAELGLDAEHVGSSRDLDFEQRFLRASEGRGVDVVLNSLAREFTDASLRLLPRGGRFVEMGKTDLRDAERVAAEHAGVRYRAFDLSEAGPARIQEMLLELLDLFERGVLAHSPVTTWDVRQGEEAFRFLREARHIGKLVLTVPQPRNPEGTVLITGGTGRLGGLMARHLAAARGARHLLLASRGGAEAEGASELVAELSHLGCEPRVVACDVADRDQVAALLAAIPAEHPLTSVIHAAGALDDGLLESLSAEQVERAMRPKVDGALHLHELTEGVELAEFVLFSSAAGVFGGAGQGNYAAANAFLDALAQARRARGLSGQSLAWGLWEQESAMTGGLGEAGRARMPRQGLLPLENGPELFDVACAAKHALVLPAQLDMTALRAHAAAGTLPALLRELVHHPARRERRAAGSLARELTGVPEAEREALVRQLVCAQAASVLGHESPLAIDAQRAFKDLGFDSLGAVELRNRLAQATGLRLPSTLIFDYPNSVAVANYLIRKAIPDAGEDTGGGAGGAESDIRRVLESIPIVRLRESGLYEQLVKLASSALGELPPAKENQTAIDEMDAETLVRMALGAEGAAEETEGET